MTAHQIFNCILSHFNISTDKLKEGKLTQSKQNNNYSQTNVYKTLPWDKGKKCHKMESSE
jgi:hypothetical protein